MDLVLFDGVSAADQAGLVHAAYSAEYRPGPDFAEWRSGLWARHTARPEFSLAVASLAGRVAGVAWAYTGDRGQYWADAVAESLPDEVAQQWVGGHLEIVELIVAKGFRRRGVGTALLLSLTERSSAGRALLSVRDSAAPARALYRSLGWHDLGRLGREMTVMGKVLDRT